MKIVHEALQMRVSTGERLWSQRDEPSRFLPWRLLSAR
jgi:hypothetical protein